MIRWLMSWPLRPSGMFTIGLRRRVTCQSLKCLKGGFKELKDCLMAFFAASDKKKPPFDKEGSMFALQNVYLEG